jgi:lysophospholipase L1-like esterase
LSGQVDAMFVAGPPPDAAVILIGANDVTKLNGISASARRLGAAVRRLRASGAEVAVATCPDFGVVKAIPQPLRWTVRTLGLRLARAQSGAVRSAGGVPVPLASLVNEEFRHSPHLMLSDDQFHPSAAGYALAASQLLPALCHALGDFADQPVPALPSSTDTEGGPGYSMLRLLSRLWRRPTTGVPAPIVATSSD